MPVYQYSARDARGQLISESMAYNNEIALREYLRKCNLFVLRIEEHRPARMRLDFGRIGLGDLIILCRQLRTMLNAGMPLMSGLEALAEQATSPRLRDVLTQIGRSVGQGKSLAASLEQFPKVFPPMLLALIKAGEEAGRLPENLLEGSRQLELQMEIRQKMISALIYPLFTLVATCGTVLFMLLYIVPIFADIYKQLHATLPAMTLSLVWVSEFLVHQGWIIVLVAAGVAIGFQRYKRLPEGRMRVDGLKLRLPVIGTLFLKSASAGLTASLAGLLDSGVPLIQALETAADVSGNAVIARAARDAALRVPLGHRLSDELEASGQFPLLVVRMIAIAEDVGTLPAVLREISASYIVEVEYAMRRVMSLVEPIMVLSVAGVVGYVLVALYYPIFQLGDTFLKGA